MRMNADKREYDNIDVYSDLNTPYSATNFADDGQEFSLQEVQQKLGTVSQTEAPAANNGVLNADVMPTQQTLTMNYQREYQSNAVSASKKVSTKTKVIAVSYVAVVLILVLGIALTSVAVSGAFSEAMTLSAGYQAAVDQVAALEAQLAVEDNAALTARAEALGYTNASQTNANTQTYTVVETRPAQNFNIETNWFDSLCDWLCNVFGG